MFLYLFELENVLYPINPFSKHTIIETDCLTIRLHQRTLIYVSRQV